MYTETARQSLHKKSEKISIKKGARQGDKISPKLFTACLGKVFRNLKWDGIGTKTKGECLNNLRFADDIILLGESERNLQKMIEEQNRESLKIGLKMNMKKAKVMFNNELSGQQIMFGN